MSKVEFDCGKWLQEAEEFALPNWSALPSIPLYMDQVMMFTGEALSLFERDEKQSLLTNSMINNYVKSGVVDHPVHKKYSKEHLSKLMMVGLLKQVLSIQDIAVLFSGEMDVLSLGDETAQSLGMRVQGTRFLLLMTASLLAGGAVSFSGLLGFVGLIVPHILRHFIGARHRILAPLSALFGASFVLLCDTLSRTLFSPYEIPVGIVLSLLGGPFFLFLIVRKKGGKLE